ncbi:hypothetical protein NQZ70_01124 [Sorangium sp. Soce836]|nr:MULTISPECIES: UPF0182 family protein [Sorangium]WCQ88447.1 hypothetical protein NQZ70_01124 [Sorangium sp. Soce836]
MILRFLERAPTELRDPILGRSTSFYLFSLPFYDAVHILAWALALFALAGAAVDAGLAPVRRRIRYPAEEHVAAPPAEHAAAPDIVGSAAGAAPAVAARYRALFFSLGALALVVAWGRWLAAYHLMYSPWGVVVGPGWTDVHVRLPATRIVAVIAALMGFALFLPPVQRALCRLIAGERRAGRRALAGLAALPALLVAVPWALGMYVLPLLFQWLKVVPNELALERPYLAHNIAFTRAGFRLHDVEVTEFPVSDRLTRETLENNQDLLSEVRLWDARARRRAPSVPGDPPLLRHARHRHRSLHRGRPLPAGDARPARAQPGEPAARAPDLRQPSLQVHARLRRRDGLGARLHARRAAEPAREGHPARLRLLRARGRAPGDLLR